MQRGRKYLFGSMFLTVKSPDGTLLTAELASGCVRVLRHSPVEEWGAEHDTGCPFLPGHCWGSCSSVWNDRATKARTNDGQEGVYVYLESVLSHGEDA